MYENSELNLQKSRVWITQLLNNWFARYRIKTINKMIWMTAN